MILVWANIAAATMAMLIGAATPSDAAANTVGSLAIMASLLFGGFMLNKDQVTVDHVWTADSLHSGVSAAALTFEVD